MTTEELVTWLISQRVVRGSKVAEMYGAIADRLTSLDVSDQYMTARLEVDGQNYRELQAEQQQLRDAVREMRQAQQHFRVLPPSVVVEKEARVDELLERTE